MSKTTILCEAISLNEARIDPERRAVEVVLIRPGWSENGRYYSAEVLAQAAPLFEGIKAYANHPAREQTRRGEGRSVLDITGDYTGVYSARGGELRATRCVFGTAGESIWPLITRSIETGRPVIGLSINAVGRVVMGKAPDGREGAIVEAITAASSVDDVTEPAAGGGFESLLMGGDRLASDLLAALSYEEFVAARPDYVQRLRDQMKRVRQEDALRAATQDRDQARAGLDDLREQLAESAAQVDQQQAEIFRLRLLASLDKLLHEAHLPPDWERDLRQQLESTDPARWTEIIERERRKAAAIRPAVAVIGAPQRVAPPVAAVAPREGPLDMGAIHSPADLVAEIRRRGTG